MVFQIYVVMMAGFMLVAALSIIPELTFSRKIKAHLRITNLSVMASNMGLDAYLEVPYGKLELTARSFRKTFSNCDMKLPAGFKLVIYFDEKENELPDSAVVCVKDRTSTVVYQGKPLEPFKRYTIRQGDGLRINALNNNALMLVFDFFE